MILIREICMFADTSTNDFFTRIILFNPIRQIFVPIPLGGGAVAGKWFEVRQFQYYILDPFNMFSYYLDRSVH